MTEEEAYYRQAPDTTLGMPERNGRAPAEAESNKFLSRLLTPAQLVEMEPPKFLVDGMIRQSGLGLVWGPYGSTKSFLTLELAASIGGGLPWQGRATVQAKVGYVVAEGAEGIGKRVAAWEKHTGQRMTGVDFYPEPVNLLDNADVNEFVQAVKVKGWGLVIIDTVNWCMPGGSDNDPKDMSRVIAAAGRIRRATEHGTCLLVHHAGKDVSRGSRGHTSLPAAVNTELEVSHDDASKITTIYDRKQKDDAKAGPLHLRLEVVTGLPFGESSCVLVVASSAQAQEGQQPADRDAAARLKGALANWGEFGASVGALEKETQLSQATVYRVLRKLADDEAVEKMRDTRPALYRLPQSPDQESSRERAQILTPRP